MTIKKFKIQGYTIDSIDNENIRNKILDEYRDIIVEFNCEDYTYSYDALRKLQGYGFNPDIKNISWDAYGQGNGLSFTCNSSEIDFNYIFNSKACQLPHKKIMVKIIEEYCNPHIVRNDYQYYHEYTCTLDYDGLSPYAACVRIDILIDRYMDYLQNLYYEACKEAHRLILKNIYYDSTDEMVAEYLACNEFYFDEKGRLIA